VHSGVASPMSPTAVPDAGGAQPVRRGSNMPDSSRWLTHQAVDQGEDYPPGRRSNRFGPSEYRGSMSRRAPYVEDYSDGEDYPRTTRRTNRRHTRPPPAHGRAPGGTGRYSQDQPRPSFDSRGDYGYESDYDDDSRPPQAYAGGGGRRGPPRGPPSEAVMRLPWTMWMNSNAKNRRSSRSLRRHKARVDCPFISGPLQGVALVDGEDYSIIPVHLSRRILTIS
jgi:hypothetical protein